MTIIKYNKAIKIVNLESLPAGTGAKYLDVIPAPDRETWIAKQWRRDIVSVDKEAARMYEKNQLYYVISF